MPGLWYSDSSIHRFAFVSAPCVNDRTIKIVASKQAINLEQCCHSRVLFKIYKISSSKQVETNVMHNMDLLIKLLGIVSENRSSII